MTIDSLLVENAALKAELSEVKQKLSWLMEQLSSNKRRLFGPTSDKSAYDGGAVQMGLFAEPEAAVVTWGGGNALGGIEEAQPATKQKPRKRGEMSTRLPASLPVEIVECVLPEDEQACPVCAGPMHAIGKELARRELKIIPAKAVVVEYMRTAYSCRECERNAEEAPVVKAPLPPQVIKCSMCTPETVAHIIAQKCVMGAPLYRQEKNWNRDGIPIQRQTMASWLIQCSQDYFEPIYAELHRQMRLRDILHSDGTVFQVLKEPGKPAQSLSQMWLYRTSVDAEHPIILYDYQPDKKKERPRGFLSGFSGYLLCDGYQPYHSLPEDVIVVGCFAHVRSKFSDALKCMKEADRAGSLALIGKRYCDELFAIDRSAKGKSFRERYEIRAEMAAPVLVGFRAWLKEVSPHVAPNSKLGKAVSYALNQWKYLSRYLLDGRLECSNNRAERSIKPFVINRKNFLFADTVEGGRAAAVLHSLTETAMENGLNPFEYLSYVLRAAAAGNIREDDALLQRLLPANAPASCRALS